MSLVPLTPGLNSVANPARTSYGRDVSEAEIKGAEFQNFQKLGDSSRKVITQAGMAGLHPDSPAYGRLMTSLLSAEASQRAAGRDPYRNANDSMAAVQSAGPEVLKYAPVRAAYRALGLQLPPEQAPVQQAQAAPRVAGGSPVAGQPVWNPGLVNGKVEMAPTRGNYSNMLEQRRHVGLYDPSQSGLAEYNQAQGTLAGAGYTNPDQDYMQQAGAAEVNTAKATALAHQKRQQEQNDAQLAHQRAQELERTKNEPEMLKAAGGDTKALQAWHGDQVSKWRADQVKSQGLLGMINGVPDYTTDAQGNKVPSYIQDKTGNRVPVSAIRAQAAALNYPQPTYEQSLEMMGTPEAMQELARQGKQMGAPPPEQGGGNWLTDGVKAVGGAMKRGAEKTGRQFATRRQVQASMKPAELKALQSATPEQQAEFWRQMGV